MRGRILLYGEPTIQVNIRVPFSKRNEVYERFRLILAEYENPKRYVEIKTPTQTKFVPFTTKNIMVAGYACLKDDFSNTCYYKDSATTALVFENENHMKEYLTKKQ